MRSNVLSAPGNSASLRDLRVIASNRLTMALIALMVFRYSTLSDRWMHRVNYEIFFTRFELRFCCFVWKKKREKITQKKWNCMFDLDDMNVVARGNVHMFHLCRWPFAQRFVHSSRQQPTVATVATDTALHHIHT